MILKTPKNFSLEGTVFSHGWYQLAPFHYDRESGGLSYVFGRPSAKSAIFASVTQSGEELKIRSENHDLTDEETLRIASTFSRMLSLEQDLRGFEGKVRSNKRLRESLRGGGRILRSATVFEDLVKTICTTNCSWALTKSMVARLVESLGQDDGSGSKAFPTPYAMAEVDSRFFREEMRAGYRSDYLLELAESVAAGKIDPEAWSDERLSSDELRKNLLGIKGVGKYAAESMMKLLGKFDSLALDSFLRSEFYKVHNAGNACSDADIEAHYECYGDWKGLVIWFDMCGPD